MKIITIMIGLLAGLLFGIATPISKIILHQLNGFQLAGLLYIGAAIAFVPFMLKNFRKETFALIRMKKKHLLVWTIIFGGILGPLFLMIGLKIANAMSVSIWLNLELVATAILGIMFFQENIDKLSVIGIILILFAGVLVSIQELNSGVLSGIFILFACISWGFDNHFTAIIDGISPQTITFIKGIIGGITNLTIGLFISKGQIQFGFIPLTIVLGIFSYGISIVLYVITAQKIGATRSQILFSTAPFWGIFAAYIFIGESFNMLTVISFFLLVGGIIFTNLALHEHEHFHEATSHVHFHTHNDEHHGHSHNDLINMNFGHIHTHAHKQIRHTHKHYPDIHHKHVHFLRRKTLS